MSFKKLFLFVLIFPITFCNEKLSDNEEGTGQDPLIVTIDLQDEHQKIHGFGASDAWSTQFVGKNWPLEKRQQIADLLFSSEMDSLDNPQGIGLSIWRFNIGAGSARQGDQSGIEDPWRRAESFLTADSSYDWTKQQGQQWFMDAASERGVENFIGFVNSPPILLTKNNKAFGNGSNQANILADHYDEFADYLAKIARYFDSQGTPFDYISPVNEPQWDWSEGNGQEGSPYQNDQISELVKELDQKIRYYDLDSKIEIPETAQINFLYDGDLEGRNNQIEHFFGVDSEIKELPTVAQKIAAHSYFTTWPVSDMIEQRKQIHQNILNTGSNLEYWMSEYCILADNEEIEGNGRDLGMNPALYVARVMHYDLTVANASSWQWWLAVSPYDYKDGLVYIDKNTQNGELYDSKLLWALGNFSFFIRPGAVRVGVNRSDKALLEEAARKLMVSAYKHEEDKKLIIVFVNYSDNNQKAKINFENTESPSVFMPYLTSDGSDLEKQTAIVPSDSFVIPGRTIITLSADLN